MSRFNSRRTPMVLRIAAVLLVVAAIAGQWWQRQPAGGATRLLLAAVAEHCPTASRMVAHPSIADGARALDRAGFRLIADRLAPQPIGRCRTKPAQTSGQKDGEQKRSR